MFFDISTNGGFQYFCSARPISTTFPVEQSLAHRWTYQGHVVSAHWAAGRWVAYIYTAENIGLPIKKLEGDNEAAVLATAKEFIDELLKMQKNTPR